METERQAGIGGYTSNPQAERASQVQFLPITFLFSASAAVASPFVFFLFLQLACVFARR